jgi:hypothetical protein
MAANRAHWHGADYAEIGAAEGISRQAARQRGWNLTLDRASQREVCGIPW